MTHLACWFSLSLTLSVCLSHSLQPLESLVSGLIKATQALYITEAYFHWSEQALNSTLHSPRYPVYFGNSKCLGAIDNCFCDQQSSSAVQGEALTLDKGIFFMNGRDDHSHTEAFALVCTAPALIWQCYTLHLLLSSSHWLCIRLVTLRCCC